MPVSKKKAPKKPAAKKAPPAKPAKAVQAKAKGKAPAAKAKPKAAAKPAPKRKPDIAIKRKGQVPAEPVVEGFFVAKVAGEKEARRHHLTEETGQPMTEAVRPESPDEGLGELPSDYRDDSVVALARDPHSLFVF